GRRYVSDGRDWKLYLSLARHLLENPYDENATWQAVHGADGICPNAREPRRAADWLPFFDNPLLLPACVGELALEVGLVCGSRASLYLPNATRPQLQELSKAERQAPQDYF